MLLGRGKGVPGAGPILGTTDVSPVSDLLPMMDDTASCLPWKGVCGPPADKLFLSELWRLIFRCRKPKIDKICELCMEVEKSFRADLKLLESKFSLFSSIYSVNIESESNQM